MNNPNEWSNGDTTMIKVKVMPISEKYTSVLDYIKHESLVPSFLQQHLGYQAISEFQKICQEGVKTIPENAPIEEKYEIAFSNWIWMGKSAFTFIRQRIGEDGMKQFIRADVETLKRENGSPAMFLLSLIRVISPRLAFTMTAKEMLYKLQWLSIYTISQPSRDKFVLNIPHCKLLDFPNSEDLCTIGCQTIYPMWLNEQFKVKMQSERQGNSCMISLTPLPSRLV